MIATGRLKSGGGTSPGIGVILDYHTTHLRLAPQDYVYHNVMATAWARETSMAFAVGRQQTSLKGELPEL